MPHNILSQPFVIHPHDDLARQHPDLQRASQRVASAYAEQVVITDDDLRAIGGALWHALGEQIHNNFDAVCANAGAAILPVVIESAAADVQALPWETLYHPTLGFLGKNAAFTLTRRIKTSQVSAQANLPGLDKGPLKVLLFTSLPDDVDAEKGRLNVEEEQAQVLDALTPLIAQGLVRLDMPDDGRFSTFKELLKGNPHVVFLSGHGKFHHAPHTGEKPFGVFLFESETGAGEPIKDDAIAQALIGTNVQAVILSACESGKAASDALTNGLMQRISNLGIPHVIGMRESILDAAGIQFARALCDELGRQERIDYALQAARIAVVETLHATSLQPQWCLPMLVSNNPQTPLIDWNFAATPIKPRNIARTLNNVSMPARFIGRRAEMRKYKKDLADGKIRQLLITGPGGQGKTSLAGKLALDLEAQGFKIFAWSARAEQPWRDFEFRELELALDHDHADKFNRFLGRAPNDRDRADFLLDLLLEQFDGQVVFLLDNLESLQDADTLRVKDDAVRAWLEVLQAKPAARLIAATRWQLPAWQGAAFALAHASYGDFLRMAQERLPQAFLTDRERLRRVYDALGGNCRGLDFLASALKSLQNADEENAFIATLEKTKHELQINMAIEMIVSHLPPDAKTFLQRLPAYHEPVPVEGILKLGLDLSHPDALMERLLNVSLLEAHYELRWDVTEYQCAPLVTDWLRAQVLVDNDARWLNDAADYFLYLLRNERRTLTQAIAAHHALHRARRDAEADRLAVDNIVYPLSLLGFYTTLLTDWLPRICESQDLKTRGDAFNWRGRLYFNIGEYVPALDHLKQSLAMRQQIGDKEGEGATLNNISQIYSAQGDNMAALSYLSQSLLISQQTSNKMGEGATLNNIGQIIKAQGDYATALKYLEQSLAIRQKIGDNHGEEATLNNISQIYSAQGDYTSALSYLKQSLTIQEQIGDKQGRGVILSNISHIYYAQGDYTTAISYLKQSLSIQQQIGDKAGEATTLNNISSLYQAQGNFDAAHNYLKQSLLIGQQIGNKKVEATTLNNISQVYHAQGDYGMAFSYLQQALAIQRQIGDKAGECATFNNIALIYRTEGNYAMAFDSLKHSRDILQQIGDKAGLCFTLFNIGSFYAENNKMEEAFNSWVAAFNIAKQIRHAQVLQELSQVAPQFGMPDGLQGWEMLAQQMQKSQ